MGNLDEKLLSELRDISRYGFEARWSRYWPLVFDIVESDPESVAELRDSIIDIEERIAASENRPTLDRLLGDQRAVWQEEAESVFLEFIGPFVNAEGTAAERQALYTELQQVRQDVKHKIQGTERAKAYPEYVLALDYVAAFAMTASLAFSKSGPLPAAKARRANSKAKEQPPAATPGPAPTASAGLHPPADRRGGSGSLPQIPPIGREDTDEPRRAPRRRRVGLIVTALVLVLLIAAAGATAVLRPDLVDIDALFGSMLEGGSFDAAVDDFMSRNASDCPQSEGDLSLSDVTGLQPCVEQAKAEALAEFRQLLEDAGGTWSGEGGNEEWSAPDGERNDKLKLAWEHLREIRETYDDRITESVIIYDGQFYPPDEERDAQGWRFAIWLCTCNGKAELVEVGDEARAHRAFISGAELVTTPHTYNNLVSLLREYFLGGEKLGDPDQVALTVEQFDLPHGLTAGPRLGGPFASRRDTEDAIERLKQFYEALGFVLIAVDLR